jgi:leucyl-tRNA synthetase
MEEASGDPRAGDAHRIDFDSPLPVPAHELPVQLPPLDDFKPGADPAGCLARVLEWRYFQQDGAWYAEIAVGFRPSARCDSRRRALFYA